MSDYISRDYIKRQILEEYGADCGSEDVNKIYGMIINATSAIEIQDLMDEVEELKSENKKLEGALWKFKDAIERKTEKLEKYKRLYECSLQDRTDMEKEIDDLHRKLEHEHD